MNPAMEEVTQAAPHRARASELIASHRKWWEYLGNGLFAIYSCFFACMMLADFIVRHRISSLLLLIFDVGVAWFAVRRPIPKEVNVSPYDWLISAFGLLPLLLRPAPQIHDNFVFLVVQIFGQAVGVAALFSLNNSMGVVAANRGVKTGGMYRIVRHPIYAGFFVFIAAYVIQNLTVWNVSIYLIFVAGQVLRMAQEERVLCRDPEYASYVRRTRWRVLPLVY
jgi:protein-S-isoprenylcysteine O-methyltransferase Ste14